MKYSAVLKRKEILTHYNMYENPRYSRQNKPVTKGHVIWGVHNRQNMLIKPSFKIRDRIKTFFFH